MGNVAVLMICPTNRTFDALARLLPTCHRNSITANFCRIPSGELGIHTQITRADMSFGQAHWRRSQLSTPYDCMTEAHP